MLFLNFPVRVLFIQQPGVPHARRGMREELREPLLEEVLVTISMYKHFLPMLTKRTGHVLRCAVMLSFVIDYAIDIAGLARREPAEFAENTFFRSFDLSFALLAPGTLKLPEIFTDILPRKLNDQLPNGLHMNTHARTMQ